MVNNDPISKVAAALFPKDEPVKETKKTASRPSLRVAAEDEAEVLAAENDSSVNLPEIRAKAEEQGQKVKQFASASSASMHGKVVKAKRVGLTALHKVVSLLQPKPKSKDEPKP